MATVVTVKVSGLRELGAKLATLKNEVALKISKSATGAAAQVIKRRAKDRITHNSSKNQTSIDTGSLLNAVVVKHVASSLTSEHIVAVRRRKTGKKTKTRTASAPHASLIEFGTARMQPEPYMRPAFDEGKGEALDAIVKKVTKGIDKALR